jgi:hypothetical protein
LTSFLIDPATDHQTLRRSLYEGDLVVFTDLPAVSDYVAFTKEQLGELFAPHEPEEAHQHFTPEEMASMLGQWKPQFIHDERSKNFVRTIVGSVFAAEDVHYDVPKPRTAFPVGHLTTGIAFAFPWHRDTWYGAPSQQINWWLPIFPLRTDNAMKFDLANFDKPVHNDSEHFDYYETNRARMTTATQVKKETQVRPRAIDHEAHDDFVVLLPPGSILLFSAGHLHASIANTSGRARYSIDFRTVDRNDVAQNVGAPMPDVRCTGTSVRDFVNTETGQRFDEDLVRSIYGDPPDDVILVYDKEVSETAAQALRGGASS